MENEKIKLEEEIMEKIKNYPTEDLKIEFFCMRENIEEEPYVAMDPHYCAIADAVEEELRARGALS